MLLTTTCLIRSVRRGRGCLRRERRCQKESIWARALLLLLQMAAVQRSTQTRFSRSQITQQQMRCTPRPAASTQTGPCRPLAAAIATGLGQLRVLQQGAAAAAASARAARLAWQQRRRQRRQRWALLLSRRLRRRRQGLLAAGCGVCWQVAAVLRLRHSSHSSRSHSRHSSSSSGGTVGQKICRPAWHAVAAMAVQPPAPLVLLLLVQDQ